MMEVSRFCASKATKRFRSYVENGPWERYLEEDLIALTVFSWVAILFSFFWFGGAILRILIWGPGN